MRIRQHNAPKSFSSGLTQTAHLSEPQLPHFWNRDSDACLSGLLCTLELTCVLPLEGGGRAEGPGLPSQEGGGHRAQVPDLSPDPSGYPLRPLRPRSGLSLLAGGSPACPPAHPPSLGSRAPGCLPGFAPAGSSDCDAHPTLPRPAPPLLKSQKVCLLGEARRPGRSWAGCQRGAEASPCSRAAEGSPRSRPKLCTRHQVTPRGRARSPRSRGGRARRSAAAAPGRPS